MRMRGVMVCQVSSLHTKFVNQFVSRVWFDAKVNERREKIRLAQPIQNNKTSGPPKSLISEIKTQSEINVHQNAVFVGR